ncbi:hypothetical protein NE852_03320 [Rhizobium sp. Pop5]|uniref:hypothetical protein n=1 Tax=Rhizobium sp. Pop5 TaxID=1223565 RepID=UPI000283C33B|nr:hypothetical protein [Rhizobium sp. Pop5]EJZ22438.1 hypothetical protein RCCGEPOP_04721 [Rhizobium sp. Pop5]UVD57256.1 hypothetical protein NE852_03320 [Rhizobium sp. Pop5]
MSIQDSLLDPRYSLWKEKNDRWTIMDNFEGKPAWVDMARMFSVGEDDAIAAIRRLNHLYSTRND